MEDSRLNLLDLMQGDQTNDETQEETTTDQADTTEEVDTSAEETQEEVTEEVDDQGTEAQDDQGEVEQESDEQVDDEESTDDDATGDATEGEEEDGTSEPAGLSDALKALGINTEGMSESDIQEELAWFRGLKDEPPGDDSNKSTVPLDQIPPVEADDKADDEEEEEEKGPALKRLEDTSALLPLVNFNERGLAVPIDDLGEKSVKAAKKINDQQEAHRSRLRELGNDPLGLLSDDIRTLIREEATALREAERKEEAKRAQAKQAELAALTESERQAKFYEDHQADLFDLDSDGNIKKTGFGRKQQNKMTELGKLAQEELNRLSQIAPETAPSVLLNAALDTAKRLHSQKATSEPKTVKEKSAKAKKKVLKNTKKRVSTSGPSDNDSTATPEQRQEAGEKVSLLEIMRQSGDVSI